MHGPQNDPAAARQGAARLQPSFRWVGLDEAPDAGASEAHLQQYGYRAAGQPFQLPAHLVRYIEPTESEFDRQVEYDMDEQDQQWLDELNRERQRMQLDAMSYEAFEIVMDRLEKEWFALVKRIPSRFSIGAADNDDEFPEESNCAVCGDNECENLNAIVFCDGCNLAVHQECYGVPYIPEGQWLCRKCTVSPDRPVRCVLCPTEGGAFKQTTEGAWAHLLCAMWIPETGVANAVYMEPIDGVTAIPKARWRLRCYLCQQKGGACIQCDHKSCFTAFHVMCARRAGLLAQPRRRPDSSDEDDGERAWVARCHRHLSPDDKAELAARCRAARGDDADSDADSVATEDLCVSPHRTARSTTDSVASKSARAYNQLYSAGPLPVPNYMVSRVLDYVARLPLQKKNLAVNAVVRYWSLKRQAMRGAPLLKRLHIEPWTMGHFVDERTAPLKLAKLQYLFRLREDLEKVRLLAELVRRREKAKRRQLQLFRDGPLAHGVLHQREALRSAMRRVIRCVVTLTQHGQAPVVPRPGRRPRGARLLRHNSAAHGLGHHLGQNRYAGVRFLGGLGGGCASRVRQRHSVQPSRRAHCQARRQDP